MALREVLASFKIDVDRKALDAGKAGVEGLTKGVQALGNMIMGAVIVNGIKNLVTEVTTMGESLRKTSQAANISAHDLQAWQFAAKSSGAQAADADAAIMNVKKALDAASLAGASSSGVFAGLGINLRDAGGKMRATNDVMKEAVGKIASIPDPARRAQRAVQVFGDAGTKLLPLFAKGREGIGELMTEFDRLGGGLSGPSLEAIQAYNEQMVAFDTAALGVKSSIMSALLPIFTRLSTAVTKITAAFNGSETATARLKTALQVLGVIGLAAGLKMALPYIGMGLVIGAIILIVDDLKTALEGGDSATGLLLDKLFGEGAGKSIFEGIKKDLKGYSDAAAKEKDLTGKAIAVIEEFLSRVGEDLVKFFVEDLPEFFKLVAKDIGEKATIAITGWWSDVKEWFKGKVEDFKQLGKDLIDGLIKGIKEAVGLEKVMDEKIKQALDAAKHAAKSKSPSKATQEQASFWMQGYAKGVKEDTGVEQTIAAKVTRVLRVGNQAAASIARNNAVHSTHYNTISVQGTGANAVRQGVMMAAEDDRRAAMAALETTA